MPHSDRIESRAGPGYESYFKPFYDGRQLDSARVNGWDVPVAPPPSANDARYQNEQEHQKLARLGRLLGDWKKYILHPDAECDFEQLAHTFNSVSDLLEEAGPGALNMVSLSARPINSQHLVVALRASFRWRSEVPGWQEARDTAKRELQESGVENLKLVFAGLG